MFEILPEAAEVEEGSGAGGWDLALFYGIPVNKTQFGFKILPESIKIEGPRRCLRVHGVEFTDRITSSTVPTRPLPLLIGSPKEVTVLFAFLTPRSSGYSGFIPWAVTLGLISTTASTSAAGGSAGVRSPGD